MDASRLTLGTAQFGLRYGVANNDGQPELDEVSSILSYAQMNGIDTLDTAIAYGESELRLGLIGVNDWQIYSKLPAVPNGCSDVADWVESATAGSLQRLKVSSLEGLLLHRPHQLLEPGGDVLYSAIRALKSRGIVAKIGISAYGPEEIDALISCFELDVVQAPLNVLDRRLITSGCMMRMADAGIELHARSVFLQGLLLMPMARRPDYFLRWAGVLSRWQSWLEANALTPLGACLGFISTLPTVEKVVIGVDRLAQLIEIVSACACVPVVPPNDLACEDPALINPSQWRY